MEELGKPGTEPGAGIDQQLPKAGSEIIGAGGKVDPGAASGSEHSDHPRPGKRGGRPKKEKPATESMEWITQKEPQKVEIPEPAEIPKVKKTRKTKEKLLDTQENLVQLSSIFAAFTHEIWQLDAAEAELIAKPLDRVLARYNLLAKTEKYGDFGALAIALLAVFTPRLIFILNSMREKRNKDADTKAKTAAGPGPAVDGSPSPAPSSIKDLLHGQLG